MTVDIDVRITGELQKDGKVIARNYWTPQTLTEEAIAESSSEDMGGFCGKCGEYCDFDWEKGFVKIPEPKAVKL